MSVYRNGKMAKYFIRSFILCRMTILMFLLLILINLNNRYLDESFVKVDDVSVDYIHV